MKGIVLRGRYDDMGVEIIGTDIEEAKNWFWDNIAINTFESEDISPIENNNELQKIYDELYACKNICDLSNFMYKYRWDYGDDMWGRLDECN